jgi:hypothetical protein
MAFLHRLNGNGLALHEKHHHDVGEEEERLFEERSHRLDWLYLFRSAKDLARDLNTQVRQLSVSVFR